MIDDKNEVGDTVLVPQDYKTVFAKIVPIKPLTAKGGQDYLDDQKSRPELTYSIMTWYRPDITTDMFIKYISRTLDIIGVLNLEEKNMFMNLICIEKVNEP
jgi:SPP1 family predicted phage head-tail adaptor